ncbi:MAG: hypothetical protein AAF518_15275 [Spirochaetota bacterium]
MFSLPLILYIPQWYDSNFYKDLAIDSLHEYTDYQLGLKRLHLAVYPALQLNFQGIDLQYPKKKWQLLKLEEMNVEVFWLGFINGGKVVVNDISLKEGSVNVPGIIGSIPESKEEEKEEDTEEGMSPELLNFLDKQLQVKLLLVDNVNIQIKEFHPSIREDFQVDKLQVVYKSLTETKLSLKAKYGEAELSLLGFGGVGPKDLDLQSVFFDIEMGIHKFPLAPYAYYLRDLPALRISGARFDLDLKTKKEKDSPVLQNQIRSTVTPIRYRDHQKKYHRIGTISLQGNVDYPLATQKLQTRRLILKLGNLLDLRLDSTMSFGYRPYIRARTRSSLVNVTNILRFLEALSPEPKVVEKQQEDDYTNLYDFLKKKIVQLFTPKKQKKQPQAKPEDIQELAEKPSKEKAKQKIKIHLDWNHYISTIIFGKYRIYRYYLNSRMRDEFLGINTGLRNFSGGDVKVDGEVNLSNGLQLYANVGLRNIDMKDLTIRYLDKKMLEGKLDTDLKIRTNNIQAGGDFLKNLHLTGSTVLHKGALFDRLDILYPVRFLTKIIPEKYRAKKELSGFDTIDIDYIAKNGRFKVKNLDMSGGLFRVRGKADIGLENPKDDIAAKLIVSTRLASDSFKIPLHFDKDNYVPLSVDKAWMASVYTGMILGGPVGMVIGSTLSEKAGAAFSTLKKKSSDALDLKVPKVFSNK